MRHYLLLLLLTIASCHNANFPELYQEIKDNATKQQKAKKKKAVTKLNPSPQALQDLVDKQGFQGLIDSLAECGELGLQQAWHRLKLPQQRQLVQQLPTLKDTQGNTLLSYAQQHKMDKLTKALTGLDLLQAVKQGNWQQVKLLLAKGANPNVKDKSGFSLLHWLSIQWDNYDAPPFEALSLLLRKGAKINSQDNTKATPLLLATQDGNHKLVQFLLKNGADVHLKEEHGNTPLLLAARLGHTDTVKMLLAKGAKLEAKDKKGKMPLHWAASRGHKAVVEALLDKGAKVNEKNKNDETPLDVAANQAIKDMLKP